MNLSKTLTVLLLVAAVFCEAVPAQSDHKSDLRLSSHAQRGEAAHVHGVERVIAPHAVLSTSQWRFAATDGRVVNLIDGSGLSGIGPVQDQTHDNDGTAATMWHAGDFDGGLGGPVGMPPQVNSQAVVFDLGRVRNINGAYIWNMNQATLTGRGINVMAIEVSSDDDPLTAAFSPIGYFALDEASGGPSEPAQRVSFTAPKARLIRFNIRDAHSGAPEEFVGLSEVRFIVGLPDGVFAGNFVLPPEAEPGDDDVVNGISIIDAGDEQAAASATALDPDGDVFITGSVGFADDAADYYQITAIGSGELGVTLAGLDADLDLRIFDVDGEPLSFSEGTEIGEETVIFDVMANEQYVIEVMPFEEVASAYDLSIDSPAAGADVDEDGDGVEDDLDQCPGTQSGETVDPLGCSAAQIDSDGDGVNDANDLCPNTAPATEVDETGCPLVPDSDNDGVADVDDLCPNTPLGTPVDESGCPLPSDSDGDGVDDATDLCPGTPSVTRVDATGCRLLDFTIDVLRADPRFAGLDGAGYTVAVLDTGIDLDHPAFGPDIDGDGVADRIVFTRDFTDEGDATANDFNGHGSHMASVIGSEAPAYPGVATGVNLVALQILDDSGSGGGESAEQALQWVIDNHAAFNIVAVNLSFGAGSNLPVPQSRFLADELAALEKLGVVSVAASGNDFFFFQRPGADYPGADPGTIAVGAVFNGNVGSYAWSSAAEAFSSATDRLLPVSQRGELTPIFAPGGPTEGAAPGGASQIPDPGTDVASAYVSGLVALAQQLADEILGRRLTVDEFRTLLVSSGDPIIDGDDEDDNVLNTGNLYMRTNALALAEEIVKLADGVQPPPTDDSVPGDVSTQAQVPVGTCVEGALETYGDTDWFKVQLNSGVTYRFELLGLTLQDPWLGIYDPQGAFVASNNDVGGSLDSSYTFLAPDNATYYLSAEGFSLQNTGNYLICASEADLVPSDSIPASPDTGALLLPNTPFDSRVDFPGDEDWLRLDKLVAGTDATYVITVVADENEPQPLADPVLEVYDASGTLVAVDDDGGPGLTPLLVFSPDAAGTYFANVRAYGVAATGAYTALLSVIENDFIDGILVPEAGSTGQTAASIPAPASGAVAITGSVGFGTDIGDRYRFIAEATGPASIDLVGLAQNLKLAVLDSAGTPIAESNNQGAGDEGISIALSLGETYFVDVSPSGNSQSNYQLDLALPGEKQGEEDVINGVSVPEAGNTIAEATFIEFDSAEEAVISGSVGFADDIADVYRITLQPLATGSIVVELAGLAADVDLFLLDENGDLVASSENAGAESELIEFPVTVPPGGTGRDFFIQILPFNSSRSRYDLFIDAPIPPEF